MKRDTAADLVGKVALITGGSRGIGFAIAKGFLERGAQVVITSRSHNGIQAAVTKLKDVGLTQVEGAVAHSANPEAVQQAFQAAASAFGPVQIVVNNAATNPIMKPLADTELEVFDKIIQTNLRGYLVVSQEAVKRLRAARLGGSIINVSTVASMRSWPGLGAYSVSKAAVNMMTQVLAGELGPESIRVNGIAPGLVRTRFSEALWGDSEAEERVKRKLPLRRIAEVEDIVGAAIFLASDASSYVTGQTLVVDGGMLAT